MMENESFNESLDGHVHVIPDDDLIEHIQHEACPCNPEWDRKNKREYLRAEAGCKVFIHNRLRDNPQ